MDTVYSIHPIAHIRTDFPQKFGLPRQSMLVRELEGRIVFEPSYGKTEALRGIEGFSHIWLIWGFSKSEEKASLTVRPPRLGGNRRVGVFATRSPFRPNALGLSCVKLERVETTDSGAVLHVSGIDMADGTPIYDIKPYIPYSDCVPDAVGGFAQEHYGDSVEVDFPQELLCLLPQEKRSAVKQVLAQDPRPAYSDDADRVYGFGFAGYEIRFVSDGKRLKVTEVVKEG